VAKPHNKEKKCGWMRINPHMCGFFGNPDGTRTLNENEHAVRLLRFFTLLYASLRFAGGKHKSSAHVGSRWLEHSGGNARPAFRAGFLQALARLSAGFARLLPTFCKDVQGFASVCKRMQGYLKFSKYACRSEWRR